MTRMEARLFTPEDNVNYRNLAFHPVFIYHRNLSLLKYLLTTEAHYRALSKLHVTGPHRELLIADEMKNLDYLRKEIIHSRQFQQFILDDDGYAHDVILSEFRDMKKKYQDKLDKKPFYKELVDSIDLNEIELNYQSLCKSILAVTKKEGSQAEPLLSL